MTELYSMHEKPFSKGWVDLADEDYFDPDSPTGTLVTVVTMAECLYDTWRTNEYMEGDLKVKDYSDSEPGIYKESEGPIETYSIVLEIPYLTGAKKVVLEKIEELNEKFDKDFEYAGIADSD